MLSIFDIFKVGVGPSSSHTNGPMLAGFHFTQLLSDSMAKVRRVQVDLYGSLSLTGRGHHTDRATVLGLMGNKPDTIKMTSAKSALQHTIENHTLSLAGSHQIEFSYDHDIVFHSDNLPLHENGMTITALDAAGDQVAFETYYSIGGGFIATAAELEHGGQQASAEVPFPFSSADEMLEKAEKNGLSLGGMILQNELAFREQEEIDQRAEQIWKVMSLCMQRGFDTEGILEGA